MKKRCYPSTYYLKNKESCQEVIKRYYKKHKKEIIDRKKRWRLSHTRRRNAERSRYYRKHQYGKGRSRWNLSEIDLLKNFKSGDVSLAQILERSVLAIQVKRCRVNNPALYGAALTQVKKGKPSHS